MRPTTLKTMLGRTLSCIFERGQWLECRDLNCVRNYSCLAMRTDRLPRYGERLSGAAAVRGQGSLPCVGHTTLSINESACCISSLRCIRRPTNHVQPSVRSLDHPFRGVVHSADLDGKAIPELSMNNSIFKEFVNHLVENKLLAPRYHSMLTAKLSDYELRVADLFELSVILDEDGDVDDEFKQLALLDLASCEEAKVLVENDILDILLSSVKEDWDDDAIDKSRTTVEFEGGAGGQESMIFNWEIFQMYQSFASYRGWSFDVTEYVAELSHSGTYALSRASADIQGKDAYDLLKFEAGVHRVQRVPVTEKKGKLQTSTSVVIVTPTVTNPRIELKPQDLKFAYFRSSGPGGQAVNTASSGVRLTHIPSGMIVECQDERSQHLNQDVAVERLRERLYARERDQIMESTQKRRRVQIGTRDRAEKIRTYNFQQGRVTDHRVGLTIGAPEKLLEGGALLEELIETVSRAHRKEILAERLRRFREGER